MKISDIVQRMWRGAWTPNYSKPIAYLDVQPLSVVLFVFLGPFWLGFTAYLLIPSHTPFVLAIFGIFFPLWALLAALAYWSGQNAGPVDLGVVGSNVLICSIILAVIVWRGP